VIGIRGGMSWNSHGLPTTRLQRNHAIGPNCYESRINTYELRGTRLGGLRAVLFFWLWRFESPDPQQSVPTIFSTGRCPSLAGQ
jgi:hypothetical protein